MRKNDILKSKLCLAFLLAIVTHDISIAGGRLSLSSSLENTHSIPHEFYEEELSFPLVEKQILANLSASNASRARKVVETAIQELKIFNDGRSDRSDYGAIPLLKVGPLFDWWCSEFAGAVLSKSEIIKNHTDVLAELQEVSRTSRLIEFFSKHSKSYKQTEMAGRINAGDYLALSHAHEDSPSHSTIVVYVDPKNEFLYTIDANNHSNDQVKLYKREYLKKVSNTNSNELFYFNPTFYWLGETKLLPQ